MDHQSAVVIGGGSGTGREVARMLTAQGVAVEVWGHAEAPLAQVVEEGDARSFQVVDIADPDNIYAAGTRAASGEVPVSLVVHTAGIWTPGDLVDVTPEKVGVHLGVVVAGSVHIARMAVLLFGDDPGHLVQIAAASAKPGFGDTALNKLAKRALDGLQEGLSKELRDRSVRVSSIYPNSIAAPGSEAVLAGTAMSQVDVASAILFAVNAPDSMDVDELVLTARRTGRW